MTGAKVVDNQLINIQWWLNEFEVLKMPHPNALALDTSDYEPEQTAQLILEHIQRINQSNKNVTHKI
ncbi:MAG: hypothetical protein WA584_11670 [Pyrinomonadaceae bacterium]